MEPVVVTGIGAVTPLGNTMKETWTSLLRGQSGIAVLSGERFASGRVHIGGQVRDFDPQVCLSRKEMLRWDPFIWYAVYAAQQALADAGMSGAPTGATSQMGIVVGSSRGGIQTLTKPDLRNRRGNVSAYLMSGTSPYMAAAACAIKCNITGSSLGVSSACTSGAVALSEAYNWISSGRTNIVLAGGTDAALCPVALGGYDAARVLSRNDSVPHTASKPFDFNRDGFVLAEGATMLVLESERHARDRGAPNYGRIAGYGNSTSARHETRPDVPSAAHAIRTAIRMAGISPNQIACVNAHAPSTRMGDVAEAASIHESLGEWAKSVPVTANKSATGHLLGASGALEVAISLYTLKTGVIPPTLNYRTRDPRCALHIITEPTRLKGDWILSNTFGFGGSHVALIVEKSPDPAAS